MTCPHCNQEAPSSPVGFTWWGGLIGAKLINHVECARCRGRYNGRTGQLNTRAITMYIAIISVLGFALVWMLLQH